MAETKPGTPPVRARIGNTGEDGWRHPAWCLSHRPRGEELPINHLAAPHCSEQALPDPAESADGVRRRGDGRCEGVERGAACDRACGRPCARQRAEAAELLDRSRQPRCGRSVKPLRAAEALDERLDLAEVVRPMGERSLQMGQVLVEIGGDVQRASD